MDCVEPKYCENKSFISKDFNCSPFINYIYFVTEKWQGIWMTKSNHHSYKTRCEWINKFIYKVYRLIFKKDLIPGWQTYYFIYLKIDYSYLFIIKKIIKAACRKSVWKLSVIVQINTEWNIVHTLLQEESWMPLAKCFQYSAHGLTLFPTGGWNAPPLSSFSKCSY